MRYNLLFLLFACIAIFENSYAQVAKTQSKPFLFSAQTNIESLDGFLFTDISDNSLFTIDPSEVYIYKFDMNLYNIDSIKLNDFIGAFSPDFLRITELSVRDSNLIALVSYSYQSAANCNKANSALLFLNSNLQVTKEIHFEADSNYLNFLSFDINGQGIALAGFLYNCDSMVYNSCLGYYSFSDSSYIIQTTSDSISNNISLEAQDPKLLPNGILYNLWPSKGPEFKNNIFVDYNLNILSEGSVAEANHPDYMTLFRSGGFIESSGKIYQLGLSRSYPLGFFTPSTIDGYWNLAFALLDTSYNVSAIDTLPLSGYDFKTKLETMGSHYMSLDAIDYFNTDSVFIIQGLKVVNHLNFDSQDTTPFYIYNLNLNTKAVNWVRKITRPYTNGNHSIAALPGNRCAIAFNEYNWDDYSGENLAVHIWVLDANGSIISQREFKALTNPISLSPNPCSDYLQVTVTEKQKWPLAYTIFNTQGDIVAQGQIREEQNTVDTRALHAGQYLLSLEGAGSAKFLKK